MQRWIAAGRVRINGAPSRRPAARLAAGDAVEVDLPAHLAPPRRPPPAPQPIPLDILYEDEHLLAVNKPAGLLAHPTGRRRDGTLVNALLWHLAAAAGAGSRPSTGPGLVSRLDRDTTGILLVARTAAAHAGLARTLRARSIEKDYLALVYGLPPHDRGRIDLMLRRDPLDRRRVAASRTDGIDAVTLYERLADTASPAGAQTATAAGTCLSLLRCRLVTGRTHQIRAHLRAMGLPLVGDPLYGEPRHRGLTDPALAAACRAFPRQALHAWRLAFCHPVTGVPLTLLAPPPPDLRLLMAAAGLADVVE